MKGIKLIGLLVVVLILTVGVVYVTNQEPTPDTEPGKVYIQVTSEQFKFTPSIINVTYGADVTLNITSLDVTHGFQIDQYNIFNVVVPAHQSVEVHFIANQKGEFKFYCTVLCGTGHADHLGTLVVS